MPSPTNGGRISTRHGDILMTAAGPQMQMRDWCKMAGQKCPPPRYFGAPDDPGAVWVLIDPGIAALFGSFDKGAATSQTPLIVPAVEEQPLPAALQVRADTEAIRHDVAAVAARLLAGLAQMQAAQSAATAAEEDDNEEEEPHTEPVTLSLPNIDTAPLVTA